MGSESLTKKGVMAKPKITPRGNDRDPIEVAIALYLSPNHTVAILLSPF
jgi:hypothetical protein